MDKKTTPDMSDTFDGRLYHVTNAETAERLCHEGFKQERSYWSVGGDISDYYAESISDDGETPVILTVDLNQLNTDLLLPDMPSISEPLTFTLNTTEDLVYEAWQKCAGTWRDCLNLVGSVAYDGAIPANLITRH